MTMESLAGRPESSFRHQMMLAYFLGYAWARWRDRPSRGHEARANATLS